MIIIIIIIFIFVIVIILPIVNIKYIFTHSKHVLSVNFHQLCPGENSKISVFPLLPRDQNRCGFSSTYVTYVVVVMSNYTLAHWSPLGC